MRWRPGAIRLNLWARSGRFVRFRRVRSRFYARKWCRSERGPRWYPGCQTGAGPSSTAYLRTWLFDCRYAAGRRRHLAVLYRRTHK